MSQHEEPGEGQDKNNIEKWSTRLTAVKAQDLRPGFHTVFRKMERSLSANMKSSPISKVGEKSQQENSV